MKNTDHDIDRVLKRALYRSDKPDPALLHKIKNNLVKESSSMKKSTVRRSFGTVAAACLLLVITSISVYAAVRFLSSGEVASQLQDQRLSAAFNSENAINFNESAVSGGYRFTLLSIVSGTDLSDSWSNTEGISNDRTYLVMATEREDGSPMPALVDETSESFYISPYIRGYMPWQVNLHTLGGGYHETIIDGVRYSIVSMENIKAFAGHGIYLGINEGWMFNRDAFVFNADPWELAANPNFDGVSVVFNIPLDLSFADAERAEKILSENPLLQEHDHEQSDVPLNMSFDEETDTWIIHYAEQPMSGFVRMSYDEFSEWMERRIAEDIASGEYSAEAVELMREEYQRDLESIKEGYHLYMNETGTARYVHDPNSEFTFTPELSDDGIMTNTITLP